MASQQLNAADLIELARAFQPTIAVNGNTVTISQDGRVVQVQKNQAKASSTRTIRRR